MDRIPYPRALNRPTYIFWRFTHNDGLVIGVVFVACFGIKAFIDAIPSIVSLGIPLAFLLYKGCVVALKPRGWDSHVFKSLFQPKMMNPGHTYSKCVVVDTVSPKKPLFAFLKAKS